jgi:hypothetical protein
VKYKQAVLAVDPKLKKWFENKISMFSNGLDFSATDTQAFTRTFFDKMPVIGAYVILSKLENNVRTNESKLINFCDNQIGYLDESSMFDKIQVLIGQNSTCVKAGEELIIEAGIGSFSTTVKCTALINGNDIPVIGGIAVYRIKSHFKAGKYSIPVKIDYIAEDGSKRNVTKTVSYTVVDY